MIYIIFCLNIYIPMSVLASFDSVRKVQTSQNFSMLDTLTVKETDFNSLTFLPNQFVYKVNCEVAEIEESKGNTQSIFGRPYLKSIDEIYEMIKPNQVERFIQETKTSFKFIMSEPKRTIPNRNMFSSLFEMRVRNTFKLFLRQAFILRSDKNGVITHTGGIYTALPDIPINNDMTYKIYGTDSIYFKNEHLKYFDSLLSTRELEILKYISEGYKTERIGELLFISRHTVETHRKNMIRKLEAKSTPHLVALVKDIGLI